MDGKAGGLGQEWVATGRDFSLDLTYQSIFQRIHRGVENRRWPGSSSLFVLHGD